MKYIDTEKLKAEIKRRKQVHFDDYFIKKSGNPADYGASNALSQVLSFIDSLQQEQPSIPDLDEAARHVYESWMGGTMDDVRRDMVELGKALNARKEEK